MKDKKTGVIFEKDYYQVVDGVKLEIKAGKTYPLTEESTKSVLLSKAEDSDEFTRIYVALIEDDVEIALYSQQDGSDFKLI